MQERIDDLLAQIEAEKQNMGAAGKKREEELLAQIAALQEDVRQRDNQISDFNQQVAGLREQVKMKEADI